MEAVENKIAPAKLPVFGTLREAWTIVVGLRNRFATALFVPFIVDAAIELYSFSVGETNYAVNYQSWPYWMVWLVLAVAAVTCHRIVLLGSESVGRFGIMVSDGRVWSYIGRGLLMGIILVLVVIPISMLATPLILALHVGDEVQTLSQRITAYTLLAPLVAIFAFGFGQLSLVLPAAAAGKSLSFTDTFEIAKGNAWRVAVLVFGAPFVIGTIVESVVGLLDGYGYLVAQLLLKWLLLPFEIAILSLCYKRLTEMKSST